MLSLLFITLSRFVITFLPRSNCLLISWLQSPSAVISEPKKTKSVTLSAFSPNQDSSNNLNIFGCVHFLKGAEEFGGRKIILRNEVGATRHSQAEEKRDLP